MSDNEFAQFILSEILNQNKVLTPGSDKIQKISNVNDLYKTIYEKKLEYNFILHWYTSCCCFGFTQEILDFSHGEISFDKLFVLNNVGNKKSNDVKFIEYIGYKYGTKSYTAEFLCCGMPTFSICFYPQFFINNLMSCPLKCCGTYVMSGVYGNYMCDVILIVMSAIISSPCLLAACLCSYETDRKEKSTNCMIYHDFILCCATEYLDKYNNYIIDSDETPRHNLCLDLCICSRSSWSTSRLNYLYCTPTCKCASKTFQEIDPYIYPEKVLQIVKNRLTTLEESNLNETQKHNARLFLQML